MVPARLARLWTSPNRERVVVEGSCVYGASFARWYEMCSFIANFIDRPGTLLDIGCANGLLTCLMSWSRHHVVPYGVDVDEAAVRAARLLLPEWEAHVGQVALGDLQRLHTAGLPAMSDFVYWNVWDDVDFTISWRFAYLEDAMKAVGASGRLCLGFYDGDEFIIARKTARAIDFLGPAAGRAASPDGCQVAVWWHRPAIE